MFASRYFSPRYWAKRYWPAVGNLLTADAECTLLSLIDPGDAVLQSTITPVLTAQATIDPSDTTAASLIGEVMTLKSTIDDSEFILEARIQ